MREIWTIGHSTRSFGEFLGLLQENAIAELVDVRSYPGSRRNPQFNTETLAGALRENGIEYLHIRELGGRRRLDPNSLNVAWRHPSFRAYADHMETSEFAEGVEQLTAIAREKRTAYMCSEAVWWRCHRGMISDYLKSRGWQVWHIMAEGEVKEHPYTSAAHFRDGRLTYKVLFG